MSSQRREFDITVPSPHVQPGSDKYTLEGATEFLPRGTAFGAGATAGTLALATPGNFIGFSVRDMNLTGLSLAYYLGIEGPQGAGTDPEMDWAPAKSGEELALAAADEYEAEGPDHLLLSGTGQLSSGTAVGTRIEFNNGKARVAQNEYDTEYIVAAQLTAKDSDNSFRIRFRRTKV